MIIFIVLSLRIALYICQCYGMPFILSRIGLFEGNSKIVLISELWIERYDNVNVKVI